MERGRNRRRTDFFPILDILDILSRSGDIRDRILKLSEIAPNFACFWPPISLRGVPPEFLVLHYKAHQYCDHVAKFRGDRPIELGDRVAKQIKKHLQQNIRPSGTNVPGGLTRNMGQSPT